MKILTHVDGRKYVEVKQTTGFHLDHDNKTAWFKLTNKHYYGKEQVPRDATVSKEHKDAHWHVNACRSVDFTIRMYEDGSMEVLPVPSYFPFTPLE